MTSTSNLRTNSSLRWVRAKDGAVGGVCKGLARQLEIPVGLFRLAWVLSVLCAGLGLGIYVVLWISLPREDKLDEAMKPRLLGVCARAARRMDVEVGVVRVIAVGLLLLSLGATVVGYIVLHFILEDPPAQSSDNNPATPPVTT